jgi:hypothetical protein
MLRCQRITAAILAVTLLAGCNESRHPSSAASKTPPSVAPSHSALPSGDSTQAGKPGTVAIGRLDGSGKFLWRVPVRGDFGLLGMVLDGEPYGHWPR